MTIRPIEDSLSFFLIIRLLSFISLTSVSEVTLALSVEFATNEVAFVHVSVLSILGFAIALNFDLHTIMGVTIGIHGSVFLFM